jgi:hypothetical protein
VSGHGLAQIDARDVTGRTDSCYQVGEVRPPGIEPGWRGECLIMKGTVEIKIDAILGLPAIRYAHRPVVLRHHRLGAAGDWERRRARGVRSRE